MPRGRRTIEVQWPAGGLNERFAYQKQPPYTCSHARNVYTEGTIESRLRGGSRPGLQKALPTEIGGGNAINMLANVRTVQSPPTASTFTEPFAAALDEAWTDLSGTRMVAPTISGGIASTTEITSIAGASLDLTNTTDFPTAGVETTKAITVGFTIPVATESWGAGHWNSNYFIFFKMDDTTPDIANGIVVNFNLLSWYSDGVFHYEIDVWTGTGVSSITDYGLRTFNPLVDIDDFHSLIGLYLGVNILPASSDVTFYATLEPSGLLRVAPQGGSGLTYDWSHKLGDFTGDTIAFGLQDQETHNAIVPQIDDFTLSYTDKGDVASTPSVRIVAGSNNQIWREVRTGNTQVMEQADGAPENPNALDLTTDHVMTIQRSGVLYMADHGVKYSGTGVSVDGDTLTDGSVDFTTDVDLNGDYCEITGSSDTDDLANGTYVITARTTTTLTLSSVSATSDTANYRVVRGLKTYTSGTDLVARHSSSVGSLPLNCKIVTLYRDRLCLTGDDDNPTNFYMSRGGDLTDWFASGLVTDGWRPLAGVIDAVDVGGLIALPLTALIPYLDDYLIFAAADAMWILRGDFAMQGFTDVLSRKVGIIDRRAWTTTPEGVLYFLSKEGVYKILPGAQQYPTPVSKDKTPVSLLNIDTDLVSPSLQYDLRRGVVQIYLTSQATGVGIAGYWVDVRTDGFWPMVTNPDYEPTATTLHEAFTGETNTVLLGCRDGYIRRYSNQAGDDDGIAFTSSILLGPFGQVGIETMIHRLQSVLSSDSDDIYWCVRTGNSPEEAMYPAFIAGETPGTWSAGSNSWSDVRTSGGACYVFIATTNRWALESLIMELGPVSEWRPL